MNTRRGPQQLKQQQTLLPTRPRRGFTILELLIGLSVALVVQAAIVTLFAQTMREQRLQRVRAELGRQGAFLGHVLQQELRLTGLGRPTGGSVEGALPAPAALLFAGPTALGFVADLPRPDASFSTFGFFEDRPAGPGNIMWHTDQNGSCAPDGGACDISLSSVLFPGDTGCSSVSDRTCPWSNKRVRPNEFFQLVAGNGTWANVQAPAVPSMVTSAAVDGGGVRGYVVDTSSDASRALGWPASWPNSSRGDAPVDVRGQGFVTTLDRVFYRFCGSACAGGTGLANVFERRQCWGPVLPTVAAWPPVTGLADPAQLLGVSFNPVDASAGLDCSPWEVVARDVKSVAFSYFRTRNAATGNFNLNSAGVCTPFGFSCNLQQTATRNLAAEVTFDIVIERLVDGIAVRHDVTGGVRFRNPIR